MKGQDKIPEKQQNYVENRQPCRKRIQNNDSEKTMEKMLEMFTKDLQELKNKQTEMNNTLEGINSRRTDK